MWSEALMSPSVEQQKQTFDEYLLCSTMATWIERMYLVFIHHKNIKTEQKTLHMAHKLHWQLAELCSVSLYRPFLPKKETCTSIIQATSLVIKNIILFQHFVWENSIKIAKECKRNILSDTVIPSFLNFSVGKSTLDQGALCTNR